MINVTLKSLGPTPSSIIGTHYSYAIMIGDIKIGELIHRTSKDTYSVIFDNNFQMLNDEYFKNLIHPFNTDELEIKMSVILSNLFNTLKPKVEIISMHGKGSALLAKTRYGLKQ